MVAINNKEPEIKSEKIDIPRVGKIVLSEKVKEYIDLLHKKVGAIEWSGMLFYKIVSGDIKQMKDMVFNADFIYPRDIGNHTYTETNADGDIAEAYDIFEDGIEYSTGLIHTHHNMQTFFSGTDSSELENNAILYNYYISLIVNFDGKYCAKIAFPGKQQKYSKTILKDSEGLPYEVELSSENEVIFIGDLDVEYNKDEVIGDKWLLDKIASLQEAKKAKSVPILKSYPTSGYKPYDNYYERMYGSQYEIFPESSSINKLAEYKSTLSNPNPPKGSAKEFLSELIVYSFDPLKDEEKADCIERDLKGLCEDEAYAEIAISFLDDNLDDVYLDVFGTTSDEEDISNLNETVELIKQYDKELNGKFYYDNLILFLEECATDLEYEVEINKKRK
jgi:hypothetical protein